MAAAWCTWMHSIACPKPEESECLWAHLTVHISEAPAGPADTSRRPSLWLQCRIADAASAALRRLACTCSFRWHANKGLLQRNLRATGLPARRWITKGMPPKCNLGDKRTSITLPPLQEATWQNETDF